MANQFSSSTPANGKEAMWTFKELLKTAGWVHQASSTGAAGAFTITPGNVNDLLTAGAMFPGNNSWWVGRAPGTNIRELMIQRGTTNIAWRIQYSFATHFVNDTGPTSITVPPTATDAVDILGDGVPPPPFAYVNAFAADGTYRLKVMAQDATPYGFWALGHPNAGGLGSFHFAMDPMKVGTYPVEDVDPYVFHQPSISNAYAAAAWAAEAAGGCLAYLKKGMVGEAWVNVTGGQYTNATGAITMATNPTSAVDDVLPLVYMRFATLTAPVGYKGVSSLFGFIGAIRTPPDTLTLLAARDKIVIGHLCADWDGSVPI